MQLVVADSGIVHLLLDGLEYALVQRRSQGSQLHALQLSQPLASLAPLPGPRLLQALACMAAQHPSVMPKHQCKSCSLIHDVQLGCPADAGVHCVCKARTSSTTHAMGSNTAMQRGSTYVGFDER